MNFEWDKIKAEENLRKHGVSFEQAIIAFDDSYGIVRGLNAFRLGNERTVTRGI